MSMLLFGKTPFAHEGTGSLDIDTHVIYTHAHTCTHIRIQTHTHKHTHRHTADPSQTILKDNINIYACIMLLGKFQGVKPSRLIKNIHGKTSTVHKKNSLGTNVL